MRPESKSRLAGLDGMRAVSIALVMFAHARALPGFPHSESIRLAAGRGPFGVQIFFVISGFLITRLLLEEESQTRAIRLKRFYLRRAFRILPAAYAFLALAGLWARVHGRPLQTFEVASCAFFFRNLISGSDYLGHFWSLAIEEQFYLAWPAFLLVTSPANRIPRTVALLVVLPFWRHANYQMFGQGGFNFARPDLNYDGLLLGSLLALCRSEHRYRELLARLLPSNRLTGMSLVVAVIAFQYPLALQMAKYGAIGLTLSLVFVALLLQLLVTDSAGIVGQTLSFAPIEWLGRISYSLYLWQQVFFTRQVESRLATLPVAIPAAILAATASYFLVEKPFLRLRMTLKV